MRFSLLVLGLPSLVLWAAPPAFTAKNALDAEWKRQPSALADIDPTRLSAPDRARFELARRRIEGPDAPRLLPPELDQPTVEAWEAKAVQARTAQERFEALFFLNRLKSPQALTALKGLKAADAATWPTHLHLEMAVAAAQVNVQAMGGTVDDELRGFLEALKKAGKVDSMREEAARLRVRLAHPNPDPASFLPTRNLLALDVGLRYCPWELRQKAHRAWLLELLKTRETWDPWTVGLAQRLVESLPEDRDHDWIPALSELARRPDLPPLFTQIALAALARQPRNPDAALPPLRGGAYAAQELEMLRRHRSEAEAQTARQRYLRGEDALARAAALEDLKEAPADLEVLVARLWKVDEYDGVQMLLASLEKWKMPEAARKALLTRFLKHPCWTARLDAWRQLRRLAPATPWPETPKPTYEDRVLLKEAARLLAESKPVRLGLTFAGSRTVTLKLDAANAPMNVANLVRLARLGFFNQRRAPRVVPDFVVQMGSPVDTMDGGPGYTVRCENSLHFYGPGSVGMALSGKDTGGCQFFITTNATPHLTGRYTRVGEVEDPDRALPLLDALEPGARLERVEVLSERKI